MDNEQKSVLKITIIIVSIICFFSILIFFNKDKFAKKGQFIIPEIEQNAIVGIPNYISEDSMYSEVKVNDNYIVYVCGIPRVKENILTLYFSSVKTNTGLIKIRIIDSENNILAESGLLNPNSYLKEITLNRELKDKEKITVKVMGYEKETYYSQGSIKLDLFVKETND